MKEYQRKHIEFLKECVEDKVIQFCRYDAEVLLEVIELQRKEIERYEKYVLYYAGKDRLYDIKIAMKEKALEGDE